MWRSNLRRNGKEQEVLGKLKEEEGIQRVIMKYLELLEQDNRGYIKCSSFRKLTENMYYFLLGKVDENDLRFMVDQEMEQIGDDYIHYEELIEFGLEMCQRFMKEVKLESCIGFLEMVYHRISKTINVAEAKSMNYQINVEWKEDQIQDGVLIKKYQEKVEFIDQLIDDQIYEQELLDKREIVRLGFSVESTIISQLNQGNSQHYMNNKYEELKGIKIQRVGEEQDYKKYSNQLFKIRIDNGIKLSGILDRPQQYIQYKQKNGDKLELYNIQSHFYDFGEYGIDMIDKIHREREMKVDNQIQSNKMEGREILYKLQEEKKDYSTEGMEREKTGDLEINFEGFMSKRSRIEREKVNSMKDDLIGYGEETPLQILLVGEPKSGKSTVGKELAIKLDIEYVEIEELLEETYNRVKQYQVMEDHDEAEALGVNNVELNVVKQLREGKRVDDRLLIMLLNGKLKRKEAINRGYVLDLPLYIDQQRVEDQEKDEIKRMLRDKIWGIFDDQIQIDEEEKQRIQELMEQMKIEDEQRLIEEEKKRIQAEQEAAKKKKKGPKKKQEEEKKEELEQEKQDEEQQEEVKVKRQAEDIQFNYYFINYIHSIISNKIELPKVNVRYFSHVVDLCQEGQDEVLYRCGGILEQLDILKPQEDVDDENKPKYKNVNVYSEYDRKKLKEKKEVVDGDDDQEETKVVLNENEMVSRPNESHKIILQQIKNYRMVLKKQLEQVSRHMKNYVKIEDAMNMGSVDVLVKAIETKILKKKQLLRPLAYKIEGGSGKDLMAANIEDPNKPFRRWSKFNQIDIVELYHQNKIIKGKMEYSASYGDRIFVFDSENNQNLFVDNPRQYVQQQPELKKQMNIAIVGSKQFGKKQIANQLEETFGYEIVDLEKIIQEQIYQQIQWGGQIPVCNPSLGQIHINSEDWKDFMKGKGISFYAGVILYLHKKGVELKKRVKRLTEEEEEELQRQEEEKKKQEENNKKKKKKEKKEQDVIEDLKLVELTIDENKFKGQIKGCIFINYPTSEDHIGQLKELNIEIDRIILLQDNVDEQQFQTVQERTKNYEQLYNLEEELEVNEKTNTIVKESYAEFEDKVIEIQINNDVNSVFNKVRQHVDPYAYKVDREEDIRVQGDVQEGEEPILYGEYGKYCPIYWSDHRMLVPGNVEYECYVEHRKYRCYGETELNQFKSETNKYMTDINEIPQINLMICGYRGSGLETQLKMINNYYNLRVFDFSKTMLKALQQEKEKRKRERYLLRGFKPKEVDDDGVEAEDQELNEENENFDVKVHEAEVYQQLLESLQFQYQDQGYIVKANFMELGEEQFQSEFGEMIIQSKRLPEVLVVLKANEENIIERLFDENEIKEQYKGLLEQREIKRNKMREDRRDELIKQKVEELEADGQVVDMAVIQQEVDNQMTEEVIEDEEEMMTYEEMVKEKKEKLKQNKESDDEKISRFIEIMKEKDVQIEIIDANKSIESVFQQIKYKLINNLENRANMIEKEQCIQLNEDQQTQYEQSYIYQKNVRFNTQNIINPNYIGSQYTKVLGVYRDRIYYFKDQLEMQNAFERPLKLLERDGIPKDTHKETFKVQVAVIGFTKAGKSILSKELGKKIDLVRVKVSTLIRQVLENSHNKQNERIIREYLYKGNQIPDELILRLIKQRVQQSDCIRNGFILDGFPETTNQAKLLEKEGIRLDCVFYIQKDIQDILKDCEVSYQEQLKESKKKRENDIQKMKAQMEEDENKKPIDNQLLDEQESKRIKQGFTRDILVKRLKYQQRHVQELQSYYTLNYNNCVIISSKISHYGMLEQAKKLAFGIVDNKIELTQSLLNFQPVLINNLNLNRKHILSNLGNYQNYCPVSLLSKKVYKKQNIFRSNIVYYDKKVYLLDSLKSYREFRSNTIEYLNNRIEDISQQLDLTELKTQNQLSHLGYDLVELYLRKRLVKGMMHLQAEFRNKVFCFQSVQNIKTFVEQPQKFHTIELPVKLDRIETLRTASENQNKLLDCNTYLDNKLSKTIMKVIAQLGQNMIKYPSLSLQETSMKFIALNLKANNHYRDQFYRNKYQKKLQQFIKDCKISQNILVQQKKVQSLEEGVKKERENEWLYQQAQEFKEFMDHLRDTEKTNYFDKFIV